MASTEEQHTFRIFLRILSVAQFVLAVIAASALALVYMLYNDTAARAANPNRMSELQALTTSRPAFICLATLSVLVLLGSLVSGGCIWRQRGLGFSRGMAVLSLLLFPIGTVIGLATLIALSQKPIRTLYGN